MKNGLKGKMILIQEVSGKVLTEPYADSGLVHAITFDSDAEVDEWFRGNPHKLTEKDKEHLYRATLH